MIAAPPLALSPSHFLGGKFFAAPVSPRSPTLSPRRLVVTSAYYSAPAAELPSSLISPSPLSLYDVLGVAPEARPQEIKAAFRRLARSCHPDVAGASAEEFIRIHAAYATLSDPDKRAHYNRTLLLLRSHGRPGSYSAASSTSYAGGFSRRSWETDQCW